MLANKPFKGRSLYVAIAGQAGSASDTTPSLSNPTYKFIKQVLPRYADNGLRWQWQFYPKYQHGTIALPATYDALPYLFQGFSLPARGTIRPERLTRTYQQLASQLGYAFVPAESLVDRLGMASLQTKNVDDAVQFFRMNVANYPASTHACQQLSKALDQQGNKQEAQEWAKKARKTNH